jgi:hypothetical protein
VNARKSPLFGKARLAEDFGVTGGAREYLDHFNQLGMPLPLVSRGRWLGLRETNFKEITHDSHVSSPDGVRVFGGRPGSDGGSL